MAKTSTFKAELEQNLETDPATSFPIRSQTIIPVASTPISARKAPCINFYPVPRSK
jgi:hypothetical protein